MIDIHTHILPGLDDGAKDWNTCMRMLAESANCGVDTVIATPHYRPWDKGPDKEAVRALCKEAQERFSVAYQKKINIYPGNEIYYSVDIMAELKKGNALTLADSSYVLVEFKEQMSCQAIYRAVREFRDGGYIPILAHIERYPCMRKIENMKRLKEGGALFQINAEVFRQGLLSAEGRWAKHCLKRGLIDFVSSDMHNMDKRPPMKKKDLRWMNRALDIRYQEELLWGNAQDILAEQ